MHIYLLQSRLRRSTRASGLRRSRGFSLIEMMIVVALIGIMSALVVPNISQRVADSEAEAEMLAVRDGLVRMRNLSRTNAACVRVTINANSFVGTPFLECDPLGNEQTADVVTVEIDSDHVTLGSFGGALATPPFVFQRTGGHDLDGTVTFTATYATGGTRTFNIYPATGFVRLVSQ